MKKRSGTFNQMILISNIRRAILKLDPRWMIRNPVMFAVEIGDMLILMLTIDPCILGGLSVSRYDALVTIIAVDNVTLLVRIKTD